MAFRDESERPDAAAATPLGAVWLDAGDAGASARRDARLAEVDAGIARVRELLANEAFVSRAPAQVVDRERARLAGLEEERRQLAGG
jgi:valyl-tRNA synthetase